MDIDSLALEIPDGFSLVILDRSQEFQIPPQEIKLLSPDASDKRRSEFHLGREAARQALAKLGHQSDVIISRDERGRPIWPNGFSGSISHNKNFAACLVGSADYFIGIDIQQRRQASDALASRICRPNELEQSKCGALEIFSMKEALYKAFSDYLPNHTGFHDVEVWNSNGKLFGKVVNQTFLACAELPREFPIRLLSFDSPENGEYIFSVVLSRRGA